MVVLNTYDPNFAYDLFLKQFLKIYDQCFPFRRITIKSKSLLSRWITKGLLKSSKRKQNLYKKYLKYKTFTNERKYKMYKNLFEKIKIKSKREYYSSVLKKHQNNSKETWKIMKEITGKTKNMNDSFPRKILINNTETFKKEQIANEFNKYFVKDTVTFYIIIFRFFFLSHGYII